MKRATSVLREVSILPTPCILVRPQRPERVAAASAQASVAQATAIAGNDNAAAWRAEQDRHAAEARKAGFDAGRLEGLLEGRQEAQAEALAAAVRARAALDALVAQSRSRLEHLLHAAAAQSQKFVADAEDDIVALAHETICRILGPVAPDAEVVRAMARQLIASTSAAGRPLVHVHPEDLDLILQRAPNGVPQDEWDWVADASVQLGGVVLRRGCGSLDSRLESQMGALRAVLLRTRGERKAQAENAVAVAAAHQAMQEQGSDI